MPAVSYALHQAQLPDPMKVYSVLQAQDHDKSDPVQADERAHRALSGLLPARHHQGQPRLQAESWDS